MREHFLIENESAKQRFDKLFSKSDGCWEWNGSTSRGYGLFHAVIEGKRRSMKAHRVSLAINQKTAIPIGMDVMHSCDNRSCVNPGHLSIGTRKDNMMDAAAKGRVCTIGKSNYTHCPSGHPLSGENVYRTKQGHRKCRECIRIQQRRRYLLKNPTITPKGARVVLRVDK